MQDVQSRGDVRGIAIQRVGIKDAHLPFLIKTKDGGFQQVLACIRFTVALPSEYKGTHMSRFLEILMPWSQKPLAEAEMEAMLKEYAVWRSRSQKSYRIVEPAVEVLDFADLVIDTSRLRTSALRTRLNTAFSELTEQQLLDVNVFSFGFKHGMPSEADLMIDVRFLPNPCYDPEMRYLTGNDEKVARYVMDNKITRDFMDAWLRLLDVAMPGYVAEGKARLSIAVGCTGGQHRSVAIANATAAHLKAQGYRVNLFHRDLPEAPTAPDQGAPTGEGQ